MSAIASEADELNGEALGVTLHAIMQSKGGDASLIDANGDGAITPGRIARAGDQFVVVEQPADLAANRAHTFGIFRLDANGNERFTLSPERCVCLLTDQRPRGWDVQLYALAKRSVGDPAGWWDEFTARLPGEISEC